MSMNVGDSSDLIHGGGGGLGVFWRSRTEFERKLLVAIVVMTLVIIGLVVAVAVLGAQNNSNSNPDKPPTTSMGHIPITEMSDYEEPAENNMQTSSLGIEDTRKEPLDSPSLLGFSQPSTSKTEISPTASSDRTTLLHAKNVESSEQETFISYNDVETEDSLPLNEKIHDPVLYPTPA